MLEEAVRQLEGITEAADRQYFIQQYYSTNWWDVINDGLLHIQTKTGEIIRLYPNQTQKRLLSVIKQMWIENKEPIRFLIPKARQLGVTTIIEAMTIAIMIFVGQKKALIIADEGKKSTNIFNMSKLMYKEMDDFLKPIVKESNARTMSFESKGSKIDIDTAENRDAGRSGNWQIAHLSEFDYFPDAKYLMSGLSSCIAKLPRTMVFMESTGNGVGSYFHQMILSSARGDNDYKLFFIPWFDNPEYSTELAGDQVLIPMREGKYGNEEYYQETYNLTLAQLNWRRKTIKNDFNYNLREFTQEYPASVEESFIASGMPVFNRQMLEKIQTHYCKEPMAEAIAVYDGKDLKKAGKLVRSAGGYIKIWHKPEPGIDNRYCIFGDTGGVWFENDQNCADYSFAPIYDRVERKIVATVHGHFTALHYAKILVTIAEYYCMAKLAIEINKYVSETDEQGVAILEKIKKQIRYHNLYTHTINDRVTKEKITKIGFRTNRETKQQIVRRLEALVQNYKEEDIIINDRNIVEEMKTYVITQTKTGKTSWNAQAGYKDDRVIGFGGVLVVSDNMPLPSIPKEYIPVDDRELGLIA